MITFRRCVLIALTVPTLMAALAAAHTRWDPEGIVPPRADAQGRYPTDLKSGPCGGLPRSASPSRLPAGATVEVQFQSNIYHQGYFRIAFSEAGDEEFDEWVLVDDITDYPDRSQRSHTITLPNLTCNNCTLQLIQVMQDRNPPTNYYSCADIELVREGSAGAEPPAPVEAVLAMPGDGEVRLSWINPEDPDLAGVLVLESRRPLQAEPVPGQPYTAGEEIGGAVVVHTRLANAASLADRINEQSYFYQLFAYDDAYSYSEGVAAQAQPAGTEENVIPHVSIAVEQNQQTGLAISATGGVVVAQANVTDLNTGDRHTLDWSQSDPRLGNESGVPHQFIFDPANLQPGEYMLAVTATDDAPMPLSSTARATLTVTAGESRNAGGGLSGTGLLLLLALGAPGLFRRQGGGKGG